MYICTYVYICISVSIFRPKITCSLTTEGQNAPPVSNPAPERICIYVCIYSLSLSLYTYVYVYAYLYLSVYLYRFHL